MNIRGKIKSISGWKIFIFGGGLLIIVGEIADLIFNGQLDLWVQIIILALMGTLLIYTMNKGKAS
jgi:hypothetical protein